MSKFKTVIKMTPEEQKQQLLNTIETKVKDTLQARGMVDTEGVRGIVTESLNGLDLDALRKYSDTIESVRALAEKVQKLETTKVTEEKPLSIRQQISKWAEDNKDAIEAIRSGNKRDLPAMQLRAPGTMTIAGSLGGSAYLPNVQVQPGVIDLVRLQPDFWDSLTKGRTNANPLIWVNKKNKQGNALFIGEGIIKPQASFELNTESSVPKKVAERMKVSTEMLYDVDYMESLIRDELYFEVRTAANTAVLTGDGTGANPKGITLLGSAYTLTGVTTTNPNNFDAIRAAITQIRMLGYKGRITGYISPVDAATMDMTKATSAGVYTIPPFATADGRIIAGATIMEDTGIAPGHLLIGDMSLYKILMYQDFFVAWGWENDDFSKNLVTAIGEMRFHQYSSSNHAGAWVYDTFANIKTAITAA
jgi:HK97 family phage major capsid protein